MWNSQLAFLIGDYEALRILVPGSHDQGGRSYLRLIKKCDSVQNYNGSVIDEGN